MWVICIISLSFSAGLKFPTNKCIVFLSFFKTAYFQKKGGEVKEEMRNFFAMGKANKTSSQLLAEGPTTYK